MDLASCDQKASAQPQMRLGFFVIFNQQFEIQASPSDRAQSCAICSQIDSSLRHVGPNSEVVKHQRLAVDFRHAQIHIVNLTQRVRGADLGGRSLCRDLTCLHRNDMI